MCRLAVGEYSRAAQLEGRGKIAVDLSNDTTVMIR